MFGGVGEAVGGRRRRLGAAARQRRGDGADAPGRADAARPIITARAPEAASMARASAALRPSPLTTTGIFTAATISRTAAQSAAPL